MRLASPLPPTWDSPAGWVEALPGRLMVASHLALLRAEAPAPAPAPDEIADRLFAGNVLVGGLMAGGTAQAFTDFRIHTGGFGRILVRDGGMMSPNCGGSIRPRTRQRRPPRRT